MATSHNSTPSEVLQSYFKKKMSIIVDEVPPVQEAIAIFQNIINQSKEGNSERPQKVPHDNRPLPANIKAYLYEYIMKQRLEGFPKCAMLSDLDELNNARLVTDEQYMEQLLEKQRDFRMRESRLFASMYEHFTATQESVGSTNPEQNLAISAESLYQTNHEAVREFDKYEDETRFDEYEAARGRFIDYCNPSGQLQADFEAAIIASNEEEGHSGGKDVEQMKEDDANKSEQKIGLSIAPNLEDGSVSSTVSKPCSRGSDLMQRMEDVDAEIMPARLVAGFFMEEMENAKAVNAQLMKENENLKDELMEQKHANKILKDELKTVQGSERKAKDELLMINLSLEENEKLKKKGGRINQDIPSKRVLRELKYNALKGPGQEQALMKAAQTGFKVPEIGAEESAIQPDSSQQENVVPVAAPSTKQEQWVELAQNGAKFCSTNHKNAAIKSISTYQDKAAAKSAHTEFKAFSKQHETSVRKSSQNASRYAPMDADGVVLPNPRTTLRTYLELEDDADYFPEEKKVQGYMKRQVVSTNNTKVSEMKMIGRNPQKKPVRRSFCVPAKARRSETVTMPANLSRSQSIPREAVRTSDSADFVQNVKPTGLPAAHLHDLCENRPRSRSFAKEMKALPRSLSRRFSLCVKKPKNPE